MGKAISRSWSWRFDRSVGDIWPILADTARFNEASKLPRHQIEEIPQADGSVVYIGRAKMGLIKLEWREKPVNWGTGQFVRTASPGDRVLSLGRTQLQEDGQIRRRVCRRPARGALRIRAASGLGRARGPGRASGRGHRGHAQWPWIGQSNRRSGAEGAGGRS